MRLAALVLVLGVVGIAPAAGAAEPVTVDCSTGPVVLDQTLADYVLVGACQRVTVTGVDVDVSLASAKKLVLGAPGATVTATSRIRSLTVRQPAGSVAITAPEIRTVRASGGTMRLHAGSVRDLVSSGPYAHVEVGSAERAKIGSDLSTFRFDRLGRLTINGTRTHVRVRQGRTLVRDHGYQCVIRVHHRR